jgi:hypothetical protein
MGHYILTDQPILRRALTIGKGKDPIGVSEFPKMAEIVSALRDTLAGQWAEEEKTISIFPAVRK